MQHKKPTGPTPKQSKMIQEAVSLHQSGQLDAAETEYKKLLNFLRKRPARPSIPTIGGC